MKKELVNDFNASEESFNLKKLLKFLGIDHSQKILVNWYHFDEVDEFELSDLSKYFDDIWFKSSDDIDLFDNSLNWFISIRHDGTIYKLLNKNNNLH